MPEAGGGRGQRACCGCDCCGHTPCSAGPTPERCAWRVTGPSMRAGLLAPTADQATSLADVSVFFSWYYFFMNVGSLLGEGGCPLMRQHVSFAATYGTIMASMVRAFRGARGLALRTATPRVVRAALPCLCTSWGPPSMPCPLRPRSSRSPCFGGATARTCAGTKACRRQGDSRASARQSCRTTRLKTARACGVCSRSLRPSQRTGVSDTDCAGGARRRGRLHGALTVRCAAASRACPLPVSNSPVLPAKQLGAFCNAIQPQPSVTPLCACCSLLPTSCLLCVLSGSPRRRRWTLH